MHPSTSTAASRADIGASSALEASVSEHAAARPIHAAPSKYAAASTHAAPPIHVAPMVHVVPIEHAATPPLHAALIEPATAPPPHAASPMHATSRRTAASLDSPWTACATRERAMRFRMGWVVVALVALASATAHADRHRSDADSDDVGRKNESDRRRASDLELSGDGVGDVGDAGDDAGGGPASGVAAAALRSAPVIAEVLEAAYTAAGLDRDPTRSWARRARIAGLIPWLTVRTGWDASWRDEEPGEVGRGRTFEVRATWRLDRLLFDARELQASTIDASRRRERRRLASYVIRAYFVWKKVTAQAIRSPGRYSIAAEAAGAELDALTDGWFSESLARRGKRDAGGTVVAP